MSRPLFSVGEEVILCSKYYPEANGDYIVLEHYYGPSIDTSTKEIEIGFIYKLETSVSDGTQWWDQAALRKKHKPSDDSFDEIMKNIKQNNKITAGAEK